MDAHDAYTQNSFIDIQRDNPLLLLVRSKTRYPSEFRQIHTS